MKQLIETVETLRVRGIGFRSLTEALDTTTAQGRLVSHMFGALAEFERSLIRERTQAGLAAARRAGRTGGRPPKLTDDDIEAAKAMLANPAGPLGGENQVVEADETYVGGRAANRKGKIPPKAIMLSLVERDGRVRSSLGRQPCRHPARAIIGPGQIVPIDQRHNRKSLCADLRRLAVH